MATLCPTSFLTVKNDKENLNKIRQVGYELEFGLPSFEAMKGLKKEIAEKRELFAGSGEDGGGLEVMTHPITITKLMDEPTYLSDRTEYLKSKAAEPLTTAGVHINISKLGSDCEKTYQNILWIYIIFNKQIQKIMGRSSRWARTPFELSHVNLKKIATPIAKQLFNISIENLNKTDMKQLSDSYNKAYAVTDKGNRYEFRGCKSSVNDQEILAWTEFCINILEAAASDNYKGLVFADLLAGDYIQKYFKNVVQQNSARKISDFELYRKMSKIKYVNTNNSESIVY